MSSATDRLRELLDERGVEHYDGTERTLWGYEQTGEDTGIYRFAASEISGGFLQFDMFRITPEQAIAATLGSGTMTVEKVKRINEVIEKHWHDLSTEYDMPEATALPEYSYDWQAIADELNETLGAGTCRDVCNSVSEFTCSACGFNCDLMSWISLFDGDDGKHRHHHHGTPNFCPNCGRRVEVDE